MSLITCWTSSPSPLQNLVQAISLHIDVCAYFEQEIKTHEHVVPIGIHNHESHVAFDSTHPHQVLNPSHSLSCNARGCCFVAFWSCNHVQINPNSLTASMNMMDIQVPVSTSRWKLMLQLCIFFQVHPHSTKGASRSTFVHSILLVLSILWRIA